MYIHCQLMNEFQTAVTGNYCELKRNNKQENNQNKQIVISSIHYLHIQPLEQRIIVCFSFLLPRDTKKKFANIIFIKKCTLDRTHIMYCELWSCFKNYHHEFMIRLKIAHLTQGHIHNHYFTLNTIYNLLINS